MSPGHAAIEARQADNIPHSSSATYCVVEDFFHYAASFLVLYLLNPCHLHRVAVLTTDLNPREGFRKLPQPAEKGLSAPPRGLLPIS